MKKRDKIALTIFAIFYIVFGILITLNQEQIIYYPSQQDFDKCSAFKETEKVIHRGTRMYVADIDKPVIILYHGNAGSACDRYFYADIFAQAGYGFVIVEYAGYSNDSQSPTHDRIKQDVINVISYLTENGVIDVTIIGESIGTGAASYHALLESPQKLILVSPFTDLVDVAKNRFWFYPAQLLVNNAFNNVTSLENYSGKTLIIHGTDDNIIPHKLGRRLFESLRSSKEFVSIDEAGHNNVFMYKETYTAINKFLKQE